MPKSSDDIPMLGVPPTCHDTSDRLQASPSVKASGTTVPGSTKSTSRTEFAGTVIPDCVNCAMSVPGPVPQAPAAPLPPADGQLVYRSNVRLNGAPDDGPVWTRTVAW